MQLKEIKCHDTWNMEKFHFLYLKEASSLSINDLRTCVYIYIWQLSSFRAPTLWFIDLTVAACHIQNTFLSYCKYFQEKTNTTLQSPPFSYDTIMVADGY